MRLDTSDQSDVNSFIPPQISVVAIKVFRLVQG